MQQQRHLRWYGAEDGHPIVYFHGAPGSAIECARFHSQALAQGVRLVGLERSAIDVKLSGEAYFERHAYEITELLGDRPFDAIGFSIGAAVALRTAPYLKGRLRRLDLVAAAAPLESVDFLPAMVSRSVFQMARRSPNALRRLARLEGWCSLHAPGLLFAMMFAKVAGADRTLAADPAFRGFVASILAIGLGGGSASFVRDMREYVRPWSDGLASVDVEAHLWHGAEDNWTPPGMADALERLVPGVSSKTVLPGLSHYSALLEAVPRIIARAGAELTPNG
jgi:pimeloyl-ACP methyl ester carboxylesterase